MTTRSSKILNKYNANKVLLFLNLAIFGGIFYFFYITDKRWWQFLYLLPIIALNIHYFSNLVHLSSHFLLSKNKKLNPILGNLAAIFTGLTFADFQATHLLHHQFVSNPSKDPDYSITHQKYFWLIPFQVWRHDLFFWTHKQIWQKDRAWLGYVFNRLTQFSFVFIFAVHGKLFFILTYWFIPLYIAGFLNGVFLFYYPHYRSASEENLRSKNEKTRPIVGKLYLLAIDISRMFHQKHHDKVSAHTPYFPVEIFLYLILKNNWQPLLKSQTNHYLDTQTIYPTKLW